MARECGPPSPRPSAPASESIEPSRYEVSGPGVPSPRLNDGNWSSWRWWCWSDMLAPLSAALLTADTPSPARSPSCGGASTGGLLPRRCGGCAALAGMQSSPHLSAARGGSASARRRVDNTAAQSLVRVALVSVPTGSTGGLDCCRGECQLPLHVAPATRPGLPCYTM